MLSSSVQNSGGRGDGDSGNSFADPCQEFIVGFFVVSTAATKKIQKLYISGKLTENAKNPKKTWQTLNELLGKSAKSEAVSQININGVPSSDPVLFANQFNDFFSNVGEQISNSVPPVNKRPEEYIDYGRPIPHLLLGNITHEHIIKTIKKFQPKNPVMFMVSLQK
jgi:hypothetical protein